MPTPTGHAVQPWIAVVRGVELPANAEHDVQSAFEIGASWWREQMGRTFDVAPVVVHHSPSTFEELRKKHGETNSIWFALQREAHDAGVLVMRGWWNWPKVSLTREQIEQLSGSPFLR